MISTGRACPVTMTYFHVPGWIVRHNVRQRKNRYRPFLLEQTTGSVAFIHSVGSVFCCQSCKGFALPDVASVAAGALRKREQIEYRIRGYNPLLQVHLLLQERTLCAIRSRITREVVAGIPSGSRRPCAGKYVRSAWGRNSLAGWRCR